MREKGRVDISVKRARGWDPQNSGIVVDQTFALEERGLDNSKKLTSGSEEFVTDEQERN